jgi:hypothetical protein
MFTADAEFSNTDVVLLTFPIETNPSITIARMLNGTSRCTSIFDPSATLNCTMISNMTINITGLFTNNFKQYGFIIKQVKNPSSSGTTSGALLEVVNKQNLTIASRSTNTRITIY